MSKENYKSQKQKELLYNPSNWVFLSIVLTPIAPAIFYYRNAKLLRNGNETVILLSSIAYLTGFTILAILFPYYSSLIILIEAVGAAIIASKVAKTQKSAYEKMKVDRGFKGGRSEAPVVLFFVAFIILCYYASNALV